MDLLPQHLEDLRRSGLSDRTIADAGIYSESDPVRLSAILHWQRPAIKLSPAIVFPFRGLDGTVNGFARVKPDRPRREDGKLIKYEQPKDEPLRAYLPPRIASLLADYSQPLGITEGEKKALALAQAGFLVVGLTGVWAWQKGRSEEDKRTGGPRELIEYLAAIAWDGRDVWIGFDFDPDRNPSVNHASAELARILEDSGAKVWPIELPPGPAGPDFMPTKQGVDDFIVRHGEAAFRDLVQRQMQPPPPVRPIDDHRGDLVAARLDSVGQSGVYLDTSPVGSGKSSADIPAIKKAGKSLTVLPNHKNCKQAKLMYGQSDILASCYPALNKETCKNFGEAEKAIESGLSPSKAVCPDCPYQKDCEYVDEMQAADGAAHRIATHSRAAHTLASLSEGRHYVSIHEEVVGLLRPIAEIKAGLENVRDVAEHAYGAAFPRKMTLANFMYSMERVAISLADRLSNAEKTEPIELGGAAATHPNIDMHLYAAMKERKIWPAGDAVRICRAAAAGELAELVVRVDRSTDRKGEEIVRRAICAVWQTQLPPHATTWLSDGTATPSDVEAVTGQPVVNRTPGGQIARQHRAVQIPEDIKISTAPSVVVKTLQAVLAEFPDFHRVGVITHQKHVTAILGTARKGAVLGGPDRERIVKVEHFRCGESRGSNDWIDECDLLIVLGTPRVPPETVQNRLIQLNKVAAAARPGRWERDWWGGRTESGRRVTVKSLAYRDRDWYAAHRAIVAAELTQAVGRSRSICEHGIPAVVVTTEPLDLPLLVGCEGLLSAIEKKVLDAMRRLSLRGSNPTGADGELLSGSNPTGADDANDAKLKGSDPIYIIGTDPFSSTVIADAASVHPRDARRALNSLASCWLVTRIGQRGGWTLPVKNSTGQEMQPDQTPAQLTGPPGRPAAGSPEVPEVVASQVGQAGQGGTVPPVPG